MLHEVLTRTEPRNDGEVKLSTDGADEIFLRVERAKQQWESTVDALPELICMVDGQQKVIRANRTLERWQLGDVKQVAGQRLHELMHPGCRDADCYFVEFLRGAGSVPAGETLRQIEAYDPWLGRHVLIELCAIPGSDGKEETAVSVRELENSPKLALDRAVILHDISEQKQLLRSLKRHAHRLRTINGISRSVLAAESPQDIVAEVIDQARSFLPIQEAGVLLLNAQRTHLTVLARKPLHQTLRPGTKLPLSATRSISTLPLDRPTYTRDLSQQRRRTELEEAWHRQRIVAYANVPLHMDGRWLGSLIVATRQQLGFSSEDFDVLQEIAELLTVALNQSLLTVQLQETNGELQQMLRDKQERMQDLSHELRSPLALIQGFVSLLSDEDLGPLTERQQKALSVVGKSGDQLFRLIERLLLLQTIGDRETHFIATDLAAFLEETVAPWQLPANNRGIHLQTKFDAAMEPVLLDVVIFPQVITNLLDNALKFTPAGGTVTVSAWSRPDENVIEVTDQGCGIPADQLRDIFERYTQGTAAARSSGAGIGLALCREVVLAHGGTISATSPGEMQGSTFTVRLPRRIAQLRQGECR